MRGRIEQTRMAKSGKTLGVKFAGNDTWYSTKHFELADRVGQAIDAQVSASEYNGSTMHWLNDYTEAAPTADDAMAQAMKAPQSAPAPAPQTNRDASIIAQALTKACTAPGDPVVTVWNRYKAFYDLATGKSQAVQPPASPPPSEFDDEIPF